MADSSPSPFSVWFSQLSVTIKDSFLSLGPKPDSGPKPEVTEVSDSEVDVSSMSSEEKLQFLQAQLASRSLIELSHDSLTPINEEMEEVESRRSAMSSRPPSAGENSVSVELRASSAGW
ncbi:synaptotagmin-16 isoform X2 [Tachysurus ichikawai]